MSSVRLVSSLLSALALLLACSRPSEPPPGPAVSKPSAQPSASSAGSENATPPAKRLGSVHDHDMPDQPPPRPPSDNATLIKASHILIAYKGALDAVESVTRDKAAAKKLADSVGFEARAGANFADLVAKYSDDAKTRGNDGRLGQISRTQMAKPFTDAAFGLMVKEITMDPVETAFGFHIIKRTE
jgi:peptidyl-prolyl cis-trans isomerase NIMA-interacting 1